MPLTPNAIFEDLKNGDLDKSFAIELLKTLIENSESIEARIESIRNLNKIPLSADSTFKFLEHLLISDLNEDIRNITCLVIKNHYLDKALTPISWMLEHEKSLKCLLTGVTTLAEINTEDAKSILIDKLTNLYLKENKYNLKDIGKRNKLESLTTQGLAEILLNYYIVSFLKVKYKYIKYKYNNLGYITELDLTNVDPQGISLPNYLDSIFSLKHLRILDLRFNNLMKLQEISYESNSLISLDLSYNKLLSLPYSINNLKSLKILNLNSNRVRSLPNSLSKLTSLQILNLRNNILNNIPESIKSLKNLKDLDLHGNKINSIEFKLNNSIRELQLGWNKFLKVPPNIKSLTSLITLDMSGNKLSILPKWINIFESLKVLNLYDNEIKELPKSIGNISSLEILILRNNKL
ncbi:MAG: leucine-rich repeat domain-containing protein, partial [Promethearchaeota archaeon]